MSTVRGAFDPETLAMLKGVFDEACSSTHRTDLSRVRGTFHSFDPVGFAIFAIPQAQLDTPSGSSG
jgi:hypothetical protein